MSVPFSYVLHTQPADEQQVIGWLYYQYAIEAKAEYQPCCPKVSNQVMMLNNWRYVVASAWTLKRRVRAAHHPPVWWKRQPAQAGYAGAQPARSRARRFLRTTCIRR